MAAARKKSISLKQRLPPHLACDICHGLLEKPGVSLRQPPMVVQIVVVRCPGTVSKNFAPSEYELLVTTPEVKPFSGRYTFPSDVIPIGQKPEKLAVKLAKDYGCKSAKGSHVVDCRGQVIPGQAHSITLAYVIFAEPQETLTSSGFGSPEFVNLAILLNNPDRPFALDHRESAFRVQGWLFEQTKMGNMQTLSRSQAKITDDINVYANPLFNTDLTLLSDKPEISFENPWFLTGELKPPADKSINRGDFGVSRKRSFEVKGTSSAVSQADSDPVMINDGPTQFAAAAKSPYDNRKSILSEIDALNNEANNNKSNSEASSSTNNTTKDEAGAAEHTPPGTPRRMMKKNNGTPNNTSATAMRVFDSSAHSVSKLDAFGFPKAKKEDSDDESDSDEEEGSIDMLDHDRDDEEAASDDFEAVNLSLPTDFGKAQSPPDKYARMDSDASWKAKNDFQINDFNPLADDLNSDFSNPLAR